MAEEILFRINLFGAESIKQLENTVKGFKAQLKEATSPDQIDAWGRALKKAEDELKTVNKQVNDFVKAQAATKEFPNTVQGLRDKLSALNKEWKNTEIGTKAFKDLEANVSATNAKLKTLESTVGDNRRNVGNYADALTGLRGPIGGAIQGAQGFNTALKANPIIAIIGLLIAFGQKLMENAKVADFVSRVFGGFTKAVGFLIDGFIDLVTNVDKLGNALLHPIDSIKSLFTGIGQAATEGFNAAKALDEFTVESGKMDIAMQKNQRTIDALTKSLKDKTKSEEERIKIANDIADLENKNADIAAQKAQKAVEIEKLKLKGKQLSAEEEKKLNELEFAAEDAILAKKEISAERQTRINILLDKQQGDSLKTTKQTEEERLKIIREANYEIIRMARDVLEQEKQLQITADESINARKFEDLQVGFDKELELRTQHKQALLQVANLQGDIDEQLQAQIEVNDVLRANELSNLELTEQQRQDIFNKYNAIELDLKRKNEEAKIQVVSQTFGQLAGIAGQNTAAGKAFAVAQAGINTYLAATKALSAYPPPFNFIAAAATTAAGVAQIAKITATDIKGFAGGGLTGQLIGANDGLRIKRTNGDNLLATVRSGEVILNERHQAMLGGHATFRAMGVPGFAASGLTPTFSASDLSSSNGIFDFMQEAVNATNNRIDRIKVLNVESDSTDIQNRVANIEARATA